MSAYFAGIDVSMKSSRAAEIMQRKSCKELLAKKPLHCYSGGMTKHITNARILQGAALKALAHPLRMRILDVLGVEGPQTASTLAGKLGESSGATSYHLRALAAQELIVEDTERGSGRERWWRSAPGKLVIGEPEAMTTAAGRAATHLILDEVYRAHDERLRVFREQGDEMPSGALLSLSKARLTPEQHRKLQRRLEALLDEAVEQSRQNSEGEGTPYAIRVDLFPMQMGE